MKKPKATPLFQNLHKIMLDINIYSCPFIAIFHKKRHINSPFVNNVFHKP